MRTRMVTITLAAVLALLGVVAILAYVRQANERAVNGLKAETVLVAKDPIPAGSTLGKAQQGGLLGKETLPASSLTTPAVRSVTAANRRMVISGTVAKGQVLLQNMLGSPSSVTSSSGFVIPQGMVAVSINMCVSEAVANYLTPGSNVAVFDTIAGSGSQVERTCDTGHLVLNSGAIASSNTATTLLVLQKAEVLAVGQNPGSQSTSAGSNVSVATDPAASSSASQSGELLVTLAVSQADAERLILIGEVGLPYLALLGTSSNVGPAGPVNLFPEQP